MKDHIRKKLTSFLKLPDVELQKVHEYNYNTKSILTFIVLVLSIVFMSVYGFLAWESNIYILLSLIIVLDIVFIALIIMVIVKSNINIISNIHAFLMGLLFLYLLYTGGVSGYGFVWTFLFPLGVLFYFGSIRGLIISLTFLLLGIIILFSVSFYTRLGVEFFLRYIAIYSSILLVSFTYERMKERLEENLHEKNKELKLQVSYLQQKDALLSSAKEKAENADRLKSEFLAQMSHEIRTPINTIFNYTWLIKELLQKNLSDEMKMYFSSIEEASKRLLRTIDMILNLSSFEVGIIEPKMEEILLSDEIIDELIKEFEQAAKLKNISLNKIIDVENEFAVKADRYALSQTIANLIDNGIKYTKKGSVTVNVEYDPEKCRINVTDTGIGISEEYLPRLFEKFTQETEGYHREYEGNGLGLALVTKYCELNNAAISVKSDKNVGTTFTIELNRP